MTTVYILRAADTNWFKIGVTSVPVEDRVRALQTGCPHEITVFAAVPVADSEAYSLEAKCHEALDPRRGKGEWFEIEATTAASVYHTLDSRREIRAAVKAARVACDLPVYVFAACDDRLRPHWLSAIEAPPATVPSGVYESWAEVAGALCRLQAALGATSLTVGEAAGCAVRGPLSISPEAFYAWKKEVEGQAKKAWSADPLDASLATLPGLDAANGYGGLQIWQALREAEGTRQDRPTRRPPQPQDS